MDWVILGVAGVLIVVGLLAALWSASESQKSRTMRRHVDRELDGMRDRIESTVGVWRARLARHAGGPGPDDDDDDDDGDMDAREKAKAKIRRRAQAQRFNA